MIERTHKALIFTVAFILAIGLLAAKSILFRQHPDYSAEAQRRKKERTARLLDWQSKPTLPILSPQLEHAVETLLATDSCMETPPTSIPVALSELTQMQLRDLQAAVKGILTAYATNTAEAVMAYMDERDEVPAPHRTPVLKDILVKGNRITPTALNVKNDKDIFVTFWNVVKCDSHWSAVLQDTGCIRVWRTSKPFAHDVMQSLGTTDNVVFQAIATYPHNFIPKSAPMEALLTSGPILMADVKVVIQYDKRLLNEPRPHYIRFWYDPCGNRWHPLALAVILTVDRHYPSILF